MCMATAYLKNGSRKKLLLQEVASIELSGETLVMQSLFGKQKKIRGSILEVDFLSSTVLLEGQVSHEEAET